jgi:hypothetical protein
MCDESCNQLAELLPKGFNNEKNDFDQCKQFELGM